MKTADTTKSQTPFIDAMHALELGHDELRMKADRLLRERGWKHTCATPGSAWMWEKQIADGRTLLVSAEMAIEFEEQLESEAWEGSPDV